jgi:hypothetical protein
VTNAETELNALGGGKSGLESIARGTVENAEDKVVGVKEVGGAIDERKSFWGRLRDLFCC